jgi:glycosyltransferase involved in cell wall biosynthesis
MGCYPEKKLPDQRGDYLLTIERWDRGNTPHILLEVVKSLSRKVNLLVAGFWSEDQIRDSFIKSIQEYGLESQVKVLGPVSEEELRKLYLNARAWIHPRAEPSIITMPMLEAATHGCPIVIPKLNRADSAPFSHRVNALFPIEGDIKEYTECVDRLVSDERLAWNMGYKAWNVAKEYSWKSHVTKIEAIITKYT